eukprot:scaffold148867_cov23-Tisochrysis_lutea.AAC.2
MVTSCPRARHASSTSSAVHRVSTAEAGACGAESLRWTRQTAAHAAQRSPAWEPYCCWIWKAWRTAMSAEAGSSSSFLSPSSRRREATCSRVSAPTSAPTLGGSVSAGHTPRSRMSRCFRGELRL